MKYTGFCVPQTKEQITQLLKKWISSNTDKLGVWAVVDHLDDAFVGWVMLRVVEPPDPELGFMLLKQHWGKGYASELAKGMLEYGFRELKLGRIVAAASIHNKPSLSILRKIGMKKHEVANPKPDGVYFFLTANDYFNG